MICKKCGIKIPDDLADEYNDCICGETLLSEDDTPQQYRIKLTRYILGHYNLYRMSSMWGYDELSDVWEGDADAMYNHEWD